VNRTPAKHAALQRIAAGGDGLGLLQPGWPDNTLDELCKSGLFTWASGECRLTERGSERLSAWDQEAGGSFGHASGQIGRQRAIWGRFRRTSAPPPQPAREDAPTGG
jgi:hypothetical protein